MFFFRFFNSHCQSLLTSEQFTNIVWLTLRILQRPCNAPCPLWQFAGFGALAASAAYSGDVWHHLCHPHNLATRMVGLLTQRHSCDMEGTHTDMWCANSKAALSWEGFCSLWSLAESTKLLWWVFVCVVSFPNQCGSMCLPSWVEHSFVTFVSIFVTWYVTQEPCFVTVARLWETALNLKLLPSLCCSWVKIGDKDNKGNTSPCHRKSLATHLIPIMLKRGMPLIWPGMPLHVFMCSFAFELFSESIQPGIHSRHSRHSTARWLRNISSERCQSPRKDPRFIDFCLSTWAFFSWLSALGTLQRNDTSSLNTKYREHNVWFA